MLYLLDINCVRLSGIEGTKYNFNTWTGDGVQYVNSIENGELTPDQYGPA